MIGKPIDLIQFLYNQDKEKKFEIKEFKQKRSLNANNYAWKLITELGNVLRKSKEEVYFEMLKNYGQSEIISMLSSINLEGYFKYYEVFGSGEINGKQFTHYKIYKGSSEFNSKEMSIFLDGIIQECKSVGIQTLDELELESLRRNYDRN